MFASFRKNSQTKFSLYPLAWLSISFASGIWLASQTAFSWQLYLVIGLISAALTIIFLKQNLAVFLLIIAFASLGSLCLQIEQQSIAPNRLRSLYDKNVFVSGEPVKITGILQSKPELAVGGLFLELQAQSMFYKGVEQRVSGNVRLFAAAVDEQITSDYERLQLEYGTRIRIGCELRREEKFSNPGVVSRRGILDQNQIDATGIIKSPLLIENLGATETFSPLAWVFDRREDLILDFKKRFSVSTAGILIASLLGNQYHLDKPTSERFREGGTFHIVVISGLQITFIGGLTVWLLRRFTKRLWLQFWAANSFLWMYTIAVGADVPVARAALMFTILHLAQVIFRQSTLLNALGASALLLLAWRPADLFDPSFQLTFICVTAIVAMALPLLEKIKAIGEWRPTAETPMPPSCSKKIRVFCETLYWSEESWQRELSKAIWQGNLFKTAYAEQLERRKIQKILRYLFEMILVSVIVQAWMTPLMVIYFHRISFASLFLNIWVEFLMAIESVTAIFAVILAQVSETLAVPLMWLTELSNWILLHVTDWFIDSEWSSIRLPHYAGPGKLIYVLYLLPIIFLTFSLYQWKPFILSDRTPKTNVRSAFAALAILFALIIWHPLSAPRPDGRLHIDFLDVGQGDSALITMPTGETLLIDGGGKPQLNKLYVQREDEEPELFEPDTQTIGESVVSNFLWERGYDKIDYLLATHADADHIQGLATVARNFQIQSAIFGRTPIKNANFMEVYEVLQKKQIPLIKTGTGDLLNFGDVRVEVLNPIKTDSLEAVSDNNHSIVLRLIYGERKILLTGDAEQETEAELLNTPEFLQADIIKVGHHGSKTSSTQRFVDAVQAKVSIISVGKESPFGHPRPEVIARWKNSGAKVLTTGENGTISISTDGKDLQLKTFNGKPIYR